MKKIADVLCRLTKGILFIGFSIQTVLGLVWMCCNFMEGQNFGAPSGMVYPILAGIVGEGKWVLYLVQLGLAFWVGRKLLMPLLPRGIFWEIWGSLALIMIPVALQCHMAALPYSFVSSLFLLELCFCREMAENSERLVRGTVKGGLCWLGLWMLLPEYGLFGGIPLVLTLLILCLRRFKQRVRSEQNKYHVQEKGWSTGKDRGQERYQEPGKSLAAGLMVAAAFGGIIAGTASLMPEPDGRHVTFEQAMVSRFAWPNMWNDSKSWPQEILGAAGSGLWEACSTPGKMEELLFPAIEQAAGEQAEGFYREIVRIAWEKNKSRILKEMIWDVLGYGAAPAILQMQLAARGYDSYSGRNYEIMFQKTPVLTKYYVAYGCWWFLAGLGMGVICAAAAFVSGRRKFTWKKLQFAAVCVLSAGVLVLAYTMRGAGMMDYKCTAAIPGLWMAWVLSGMGISWAEDESSSDNVEK